MIEGNSIPELADYSGHAGVRDDPPEAEESAVARSHAQILDMILSFRIKPGERVNESEISRRLGVSRTPLREALNRLVTEGFLSSRPAKGFFCRSIDADEIFQLYQLRLAIEIGGIKLSITRDDLDAELDDLEAFMATSRSADDAAREMQVGFDEAFHEKLMQLSRNQEMLNVLRSVNRKIRSVRWIDLSHAGRQGTQNEHDQIIAALRRRDRQGCIRILENHISRRLDQIDSAIREVYGRIYAGPPR